MESGLRSAVRQRCGEMKHKLKSGKLVSLAVSRYCKTFLAFVSLVLIFFPQPDFAEPIIVEMSIPVGKKPRRALTVPERNEIYLTAIGILNRV